MIGLTNAHYWTRIILPLEEGDNINFGTPVKLLRVSVTRTVSLLTYLFLYLWGVPFYCRYSTNCCREFSFTFIDRMNKYKSVT